MDSFIIEGGHALRGETAIEVDVDIVEMIPKSQEATLQFGGFVGVKVTEEAFEHFDLFLREI